MSRWDEDLLSLGRAAMQEGSMVQTNTFKMDQTSFFLFFLVYFTGMLSSITRKRHFTAFVGSVDGPLSLCASILFLSGAIEIIFAFESICW